MTSLVSHITQSVVSAHGTSSTVAGLAAIVLLLGLLLEREVIRAYDRSPGHDGEPLRAAILPLLLVFVIIVVHRFLVDILHVH